MLPHASQWRQGFVDAEHRIGVSDKDHSGDWWGSRLVGDLGLTVRGASARIGFELV